MKYKDIILSRDSNIGIITINRPEVLNALRMNTKDEIEDALNCLDADDEIRGIIITGTGKGFISGSDISEISVDAEGSETVAMSKQAHKPF